MTPEDARGLLRLGARQLGLALTPAQQRALFTYLEQLARWNRSARLTGYRTERARMLHLVLESLLLLPLLPRGSSPLLDIGSGAGVPGLILKIARPELAVTVEKPSFEVPSPTVKVPAPTRALPRIPDASRLHRCP